MRPSIVPLASYRHSLLLDGILVLLLVTAVLLVCRVYVSSEHVFYASDYVGYQDITHRIADQTRHSLFAGIKAVMLSRGSEYNAIFTIPLLPLVLIFGNSRMAYESIIAVVYLVPFVLTLGAVTVKLIPGRPHAVFWSAVALALLTPATWIPTLRGYPDTGAAVLVWLAVWVYLHDTRLGHHWQIPVIACLLSGSMLFRRHFVYAAAAFFVAMLLHALLRFAVRRERRAASDLRNSGIRIGLVALTALLTLVVLDHLFVVRLLTTNYNALYAAYMEPPSAVLEWLSATYGWVAWLGALAGLVIGLRSRTVACSRGVFVVVFGGALLVLWTVVARQANDQYTLHFTPLVVLGLAALGWTGWLRAGRTSLTLSLCVVGLYMLSNVLDGLAPFQVASSSTVRPIFAAHEAPLRESNYESVTQLVTYLHRVASHGEPVYVAASSPLLNPSLVISAEHALYGWDQSRLDILYVPQVDSRDPLPLETLFKADYVVVVSPVQHHVSLQQQRVVQVVVDLFARNHAIARDFIRLPSTFVLAKGTVTSIYRRVRPTSLRTALRTLHEMEQALPTRPGGQLDWMVLNREGAATIAKNLDSTYTATVQPDRTGALPMVALLYLGPVPYHGMVRGEVMLSDQHCTGITLHLSRAVGDRTTGVSAVPLRPHGPSTFALAFAKHRATELLLGISSGDGGSSLERCSLSMDRLRLVSER